MQNIEWKPSTSGLEYHDPSNSSRYGVIEFYEDDDECNCSLWFEKDKFANKRFEDIEEGKAWAEQMIRNGDAFVNTPDFDPEKVIQAEGSPFTNYTWGEAFADHGGPIYIILGCNDPGAKFYGAVVCPWQVAWCNVSDEFIDTFVGDVGIEEDSSYISIEHPNDPKYGNVDPDKVIFGEYNYDGEPWKKVDILNAKHSAEMLLYKIATKLDPEHAPIRK